MTGALTWPKLCGNPRPKTLPAPVFSLSSLWIINDPFELQSCVNAKNKQKQVAGCGKTTKTFNLSLPTQHPSVFGMSWNSHCRPELIAQYQCGLRGNNSPHSQLQKNLPTGVRAVIATARCSGFLRRQQNIRCQSALLVPAKLIIWWLWD